MLAVGLVGAACTGLPTPPASVPPTGGSEQSTPPSAAAVTTPIPSAVATPVPSAVPTPVPSPVPTPVPSASDPVPWQEPASYSFTLESQCGERALIGRFHVEVENGETIRVKTLSGYGGSGSMPPAAVPTLTDLLTLVARARSERASQVNLVVDPIDGHPVSVSVDWRADTIDEEECYEITDYLPAPIGVAATSSNHSTGVTLPDGFAVTPLLYVD
jgi:hypothetical protein